MKYWLDTEFDDSGDNLDMISIGTIAEDGREFYAVSTDFDPDSVKPWVKENVLPLLEPTDSPVWKSSSTIADVKGVEIPYHQAEAKPYH